MNPAHLDYDVLADLAEGLLDDDHAASASAHLESCTECRERSAELADVPALLADIPVPPMPDDLATRIDEAIRAESMAAFMDKATVASMEHRRGKRHLRIFSAAAAAVVVLGGAAVAGSILLEDGRKADAPSAARPQLESRASDPEDSGGGGTQNGARPDTQARKAGPALLIHSGTSYGAATLGGQIPVVVKEAQEGSMAAFSLNPQLEGCIERVAGNAVPVLVDVAQYDGRPATIFVLPAGGSMWQIVIVGQGCSAHTEDRITTQQIPSKTPS